MEQPIAIAQINSLEDKTPQHALVNDLDLVIIKYEKEVSVLYGRCLHRGALMADGHVEGDNLICGVHGWDYRYDTGVSEYNNKEVLHKFSTKIEGDTLYVDEKEINAFVVEHPQPFNRNEYLGVYADTHPEDTEPYTNYIKDLRLTNSHHLQLIIFECSYVANVTIVAIVIANVVGF